MLVRRVNDNLTLVCELRGDSGKRRFVWNYVSENSTLDRPFKVEPSGPAASSTLYRDQLQESDSGHYMCSAPPFSVTKYILVQSKGPKFCGRGTFWCGVRCMATQYVCDGRADCERGEDEAPPMCPQHICSRPDKLNCSTGRCISELACCRTNSPLCQHPSCCDEHPQNSRLEGYVDVEYPPLFEDRHAPDGYAFIQSTIYTVTDVYGKYLYHSGIKGWIATHKVVATWDEAYQQCQSEGAVLASPTTVELRNMMQELIAANPTQYFTGIRARYINKIYASTEGALLDDMPVSDFINKLDPEEGQCIVMNVTSISPVACTSRMPYMCYKKENKNVALTECGTYDKEYKLIDSTGSCYKFHNSLSNWGEAYQTCIDEGAYLAIINDKSEAKAVISNIIKEKSHYVLLGIEDWKGTNNWISIHGEPIGQLFNVWLNSNKTEKATRCATLDPDEPKLKDFGDCLNTKFFFLCEKDPSIIKFSVEEQVREELVSPALLT